MGFEVVHGSPQTIWVPLNYETTIYVGSIACLDISTIGTNSGVNMLPAATGIWNATGFDIPFGVVIGTNLRRPLFNTTYKCEEITSASPLASTTEFVGVEGPYIKGGREHMVKVAVIDPSTVCRSNIVTDSISGAPTILTATATVSAGTSMAHNANAVACLDGWSTIYFRSGLNKGTYRILSGAAVTTASAWTIPTYAPVTTGDKAVVVNMRPFGISQAQLLATGLTCFDSGTTLGSNYFGIDVVRLDLSEQYHEYVEFRWNIINFYPATNRD